MAQYDTADMPRVSGWAIGGISFAGTMLILIGVFQAIDGLVAIFNDELLPGHEELHVRPRRHSLGLDPPDPRDPARHHRPGPLRREPWAGMAGIVLAMLSAIANFFFIPYYPFWSILVIGARRLGALGADAARRNAHLRKGAQSSSHTALVAGPA